MTSSSEEYHEAFDAYGALGSRPIRIPPGFAGDEDRDTPRWRAIYRTTWDGFVEILQQKGLGELQLIENSLVSSIKEAEKKKDNYAQKCKDAVAEVVRIRNPEMPENERVSFASGVVGGNALEINSFSEIVTWIIENQHSQITNSELRAAKRTELLDRFLPLFRKRNRWANTHHLLCFRLDMLRNVKWRYLVSGDTRRRDDLVEAEEDGLADPIDQRDVTIENLSNEIGNYRGVLVRQRNQIIALRRQQGKPTHQEMKDLIDENRKTTGQVNLSGVGRKLGRNHKTVKTWIKEMNLSDYAGL